MFRNLIASTFLGTVIVLSHAFAQQPQMSPEMQGYMEKMQKMTPEEREAFTMQMQEQGKAMQDCMKGVKPEEMQALKERGERIQAEIKRMCDAGKRGNAELYSMQEGQAYASNPTVLKMQSCSKNMGDSMPFLQAAKDKAKTEKMKHICDQQ